MRNTKYLSKLQNAMNINNIQRFGIGTGDPNMLYHHLYDDCNVKKLLYEAKHQTVDKFDDATCGICRKRFYEINRK
jgi:hypothetical protein